jgi:glucokinase
MQHPGNGGFLISFPRSTGIEAKPSCDPIDPPSRLGFMLTHRTMFMTARPGRSPTERETMPRRLEQTLLGDIGATNARFALLANGALGPVSNFEVARYARFPDAVADFLKVHGDQVPVTDALLAIAGPVEGERCKLTNCSWIIDGDELRATFRLAKVRVVNDFAATAYSLPSLSPADLHAIGGGRAVPEAPMAVLGPGTGLGVACLVPGSKESVVIAGEGGHATIAAASHREDAVIDHLRRRFGHVSAERVVSGAGLENIYQAIAALDQSEVPARDAAEITRTALDGSCPTAGAALHMFCALLGSFSGNVALMFGARGGIYIAGGIAPMILAFMGRSEFRRRFEDKGRLRPYLAAIPSNVIVHSAAAFVGLKALAASWSNALDR